MENGDKIIKIGIDGRCLCRCCDPCPLHKIGIDLRCTEEELNVAGIKTERIIIK